MNSQLELNCHIKSSLASRLCRVSSSQHPQQSLWLIATNANVVRETNLAWIRPIQTEQSLNLPGFIDWRCCEKRASRCNRLGIFHRYKPLSRFHIHVVNGSIGLSIQLIHKLLDCIRYFDSSATRKLLFLINYWLKGCWGINLFLDHVFASFREGHKIENFVYKARWECSWFDHHQRCCSLCEIHLAKSLRVNLRSCFVIILNEPWKSLINLVWCARQSSKMLASS